MNPMELTGRAGTHIIELQAPRCALHYEVIASFLAMRDAALAAAVELSITSSFRSFDAQVTIWNRKWSGEKPLYDRSGQLLERARMSDGEVVDAILAWSAVPGG